MFLPKPNAMTMPTCASPVGIGLEACNSGNSCSTQSCDVNSNSGSGSCGASLGWTAAGAVFAGISAAAAAAS